MTPARKNRGKALGWQNRFDEGSAELVGALLQRLLMGESLRIWQKCPYSNAPAVLSPGLGAAQGRCDLK